MNKEKLVPRLRFESFLKKLDWKYTKLGEVADIVGGGTPSTQIEKYWNGDINWFSPTEIGETSYLNSSERKITKLGLKKSSAKLLPIGTVLFTSRAGIGKTAILEKESTTNQGFQSIVPKKNILNSYFIYSRNEEIKNYAEIVGAGSTFVEVSGKQLEKMMLLIPELKEQQKIGSFFEKIDKLIQLQQSKVNKVKDIKSAYLSEMFPKEGEKYPKRRFEGFTEPWKKRTLNSIANSFDMLRIPVTAADRIPGDTPYYGANGIQDYIDGYTHDGEYILLAEDGANDLKNYPVHYVNGKVWVNNHAHVLQGNPEALDNRFLMYKLKTIDMEPYLVGGGRAKLNANVMMNIELSLPNLEEQIKIGSFFKNLDKQISIEEEKLVKLEKLKQGYLNDMFV